MQLAATVTLLLLALPAGRSMGVLMGATLLLNLIAATQDIATDGLAVEMLRSGERGLANGLQVAGYRVGMIVGGGVLLVLHDRLGAPATFVAMAMLTALASVPVLRLREPPPVPAAPTAAPAVHFLRLPGARRVLVLVVVYKAGEAFATGMLRPFLHDAGMSLADVGWMIGTVGFVAGMLGALAGGVLVNRVGRRPALLGFGVLQAATVAGYAAVALAHPGRPLLYAFCAVEHFVSGMATAALFTCMMDWSRPAHAATDYTVQASAVVVATGLAAVLSGASAQALGYPLHFALAALFSLAAVAVVAAAFPRERHPA
jgi:PAT family beta-lactamase induction signal transducer AmpG